MSEPKSNDSEIWQTSICHRCDGAISIEDSGHCVIKHYIGGKGHRIYLGFHPECYIDDELSWRKVAEGGRYNVTGECGSIEK